MTVRHLLQRGLVLAGVMSLVACQPGAAPTPPGGAAAPGGANIGSERAEREAHCRLGTAPDYVAGYRNGE